MTSNRDRKTPRPQTHDRHQRPKSNTAEMRSRDAAPTWVYEGAGSRYRLPGFRPTVTVVLGWDRPLGTFFAQVWDVPAGAGHHEEGELLEWLGTTWEECSTPDELAERLAEFATVPDDLRLQLFLDSDGLGNPAK